MSPALHDYFLLWRMALSSRHPHAGFIVLAFTTLAAATTGLLVQMKTGDPVLALGLAARIVPGGLIAGWAMYFLPGAIKLNTPANARLVPAMRRRLMGLTAGAWLLATILAALLAVGTPVPPALVFLGTGTFITTIALARTGHRAGALAQWGFFPFIVFTKEILVRMREHLEHGSGLAAATLLLLAYSAFTLRTMFLNGGDRHHALRERQALQTERLTPKGQFREREPNPVFTTFYLAALRRDCAGRDAGKLLGHLLGAREHWTGQLLALAGVTLVLGAALLALRFFDGETLRLVAANGGWVFASTLMLVPLFDHERRNTRLMDTRGEQTLLRLAPAMPANAAAFNRKLAGAQLRIAISGWCLQVGAVGLLMLAAGASASFYLLQLCLCCLTLPLIGVNLRRHARHAGLPGLVPAFALLVNVGISFAAGAAINAASGLPVAAGAALTSVLIALVVVPWRWKRSVEAPIAFRSGDQCPLRCTSALPIP